uniref:TRAP transporter, 4TM/12TM fusion protein n=1 Tax=Candidatus Kentrum sp. FM TaxID=2126340 RepID=A0A450T464_9GAMM|nr:MAG: TRAP transporter, 4TM/12TM fusion protein [Candidatus Kentron sp. FM]VFJ61344.1 MAG: TRAP transporter, 4TM/12TM fusion protein [Candidatus Kentron sp. FM]VFK08955.1 MAG: TRAP transporter, 4TM/12TM fusion protein [Candidatus Kentron sp. FM]
MSILERLTALLGGMLALFAIYVAGFGSFTPSLFRGGAVFFSVLLVCLEMIIATQKEHRDVLRKLIPIGLLVAGTAAVASFSNVQIKMDVDIYQPEGMEIWIACIGMVVLLELARRLWGMSLFLVASAFVVYGFAGEYLPGVFHHTGFDIAEIVDAVWYNYAGVFGTPVSIIAGLVWVFIIFGVLLKGTGAGDSLLRISLVLTARTRGGPAHGAIVASSLFGTMSGASIANVVSTGTFTIPMIKKRGFSPEFAGGIEATASSGGQIVPPIMGAAAFLMAEVTGISYLTVAIAAIVPACLYYLSLFLAVGIEARRLDIKPTDASEIPKLTRHDALASLGFVLPIVVMIGALIVGFSAAFAGFAGAITAVVAGFVNPELRRAPQRLLASLAEAGSNAAKLMVAVAVIGMILGIVNMTGIGLRFAGLIEQIGQGSLFLSLVLTMVGAIVLGMGMPTLPAYLIIVVIMGPAFTGLGVELLVIHLFVLYYAVASGMTPPVALVSYAAASIARADPIATSSMAIKLGAVKYLLPFVLVAYPSLLLMVDFTWTEFLWALPRVILMIWLASTALGGYAGSRLGSADRFLRLLAALLIVIPYGMSQLAGIVLAVVLVLVIPRVRRKKV